MKHTDFQQVIQNLQKESEDVLGLVDPSVVENFIITILNAKRIFMAGRGRTGLQMRSFAMRLMHLGLEVFVLEDVTTPSVQAEDLLIIGSASGKTDSLVVLAEKAVSLGVEIISITSQAHNPISNYSVVNIILPAPSHKNYPDSKSVHSVQPVGGLFEAALGILLNALVIILAQKTGTSEDEMIYRHANLE